jgi:hypothetical protein
MTFSLNVINMGSTLYTTYLVAFVANGGEMSKALNNEDMLYIHLHSASVLEHRITESIFS